MTFVVRRVVLATACVLFLSMSASAHHGGASFDPEQKLVLKGTVTEWLWANPHCFLRIDVKNAQTGEVVDWSVEFGNPTDISIRGLRRTTFKTGDEVTLTLQPVKSGAPVGRAIGELTLADGRKF